MSTATDGTLAALIDRVAGRARAIAGMAGVELSVSLAPGLATVGAAGRLEQALLLLLGNALEQTPRGGRIAVAAEADANGGIAIELRSAAPDGDPQGLPPARYLVELGCGAATARSVKRAHALLAPDKGTVGFARTRGRDETITIRLPPDRGATRAA
jgi:signal transduction histidine kinase